MQFPPWLFSKITQLQSLGFFAGQEPDAIAQQLVTRSESSYFGTILDLQEEPYIDLILLSLLDPAVWMIEDYLVLGQTEAFQEEFYPKVLQKLAAISGGRFQPQRIELEECGHCKGRDKRVLLRFDLEEGERKTVELNFCIDGGGLVLDFLVELNEVLASTGFAYKALRDPYGLCFVLFLSESQASGLVDGQIWAWDEFPGYWFERARFARDQEDDAAAIHYFEKAKSGAFDPAVYSEYGFYLLGRNQVDQAVELYREAHHLLQAIQEATIRDNWWISHFRRAYQEHRQDEP